MKPSDALALSVSLAIKRNSNISEGSSVEQTGVRFALCCLQWAAVRRVFWNNSDGFWKLSYFKSLLNEERGSGKVPALSPNFGPFVPFITPQYYQSALFFLGSVLCWAARYLKSNCPWSSQADWFYFYRKIKWLKRNNLLDIQDDRFCLVEGGGKEIRGKMERSASARLALVLFLAV